MTFRPSEKKWVQAAIATVLELKAPSKPNPEAADRNQAMCYCCLILLAQPWRSFATVLLTNSRWAVVVSARRDATAPLKWTAFQYAQSSVVRDPVQVDLLARWFVHGDQAEFGWAPPVLETVGPLAVCDYLGTGATSRCYVAVAVEQANAERFALKVSHPMNVTRQGGQERDAVDFENERRFLAAVHETLRGIPQAICVPTFEGFLMGSKWAFATSPIGGAQTVFLSDAT